ncbi:hypothetical protein HME9302_02430 [Alteripontixanthobacter maritimus]|uniref:Secreted protein n=1 Tax=Alteripontixanthobacter maritimus TaxID=2161824 RepID=A0A369Q8J7_9SPHN|nr:hypothetical protein [Alteripontixanthobacter maritimus]RDC61211.1 hypothetical protein HME9302_02430 [Alteripontixanthobacter maritimus]
MKKTFAFAVLGTAAFMLSACDVDQTEEGDMPEVDVEGGNLPEYDVSAPDVDVDTNMEMPTLDVDVEPADDAEGEPVTGETE